MHVATVTSTVQYVNEEEHPLEAVFVFPMPLGASVCQFSAKIADRDVVAEVQEKQEVRFPNNSILMNLSVVFCRLVNRNVSDT